MIPKHLILKTYHKEKQFERIMWQVETPLNGLQQVKSLAFGGKTKFLSYIQMAAR